MPRRRRHARPLLRQMLDARPEVRGGSGAGSTRFFVPQRMPPSAARRSASLRRDAEAISLGSCLIADKP